MSAILIAVVALFGNTSEENSSKLTGLGYSLLALIFIAGTFSFASLVLEEREKNTKELETVVAKKSVYFRLIDDIENLKHAFLWKEYGFFSKPTALFDYEKNPKIFMSPNDKDLSKINNLVTIKLRDNISSMSLAYNTNREYLNFKEADSLSHLLETIKYSDIYSVLSKYNSSEAHFSEYLESNNLSLRRIEYLFMSIYALEKDIKEGSKLNKKRFYELRPECKDPAGTEHFYTCI
jgi:hypothetical protein